MVQTTVEIYRRIKIGLQMWREELLVKKYKAQIPLAAWNYYTVLDFRQYIYYTKAINYSRKHECVPLCAMKSYLKPFLLVCCSIVSVTSQCTEQNAVPSVHRLANPLELIRSLPESALISQ